MIHIAVCDDETYTSDQIRSFVSGFFREKNIETMIRQFTGGEELLQYDGPIDILFLDIQMNGINGMEAAAELRRRKFRGFIIFITVLEEMVFQAFGVHAYDYLVKPVEKRCFEKVMDRLLTSMQNAGEEHLLVQKGHERSIVSLDDIVYCEVIDRKIYLHLVSSDTIDYYERIETLEQKLDGRFFRCHRSFLINLKHLKSFNHDTAYMENGTKVPVSRLRNRGFSDAVLQYMKDWRL